MLRRCDRYLLREMVGPFFLALAGLVLFILLNIILSLSDLMVDRGIGMLTLLRLVALKMPSLLVIAVPMSALFATFLGLGRLVHDREIVALESLGIPLRRILVPLIVAATAVGIADFAVYNWGVPASEYAYQQELRGVIFRQGIPRITANAFFKGADNQFFYIRRYDEEAGTLHDIHIYDTTGRLFPHAQSRVTMITAETGRWTGAAWLLESGHVYGFDGDGILAYSGSFEELTIPLEQSVEEILSRSRTPSEMGIAELSRRIEVARRTGQRPDEFLVEKHLKFSLPLATIVFVLVGGTMSLMFNPRSRAVGIVVGLLLVAFFQGVLWWTQTLGRRGAMNPVLSAWFPDIVFGLFGLALFVWLDRLASREIWNRIRRYIPFAGLVLLLVAIPCFGENVPLDLESDWLQISEDRKAIFAEGNVRVTIEEIRLDADALSLVQDDAGAWQLSASGGVRLRSGEDADLAADAISADTVVDGGIRLRRVDAEGFSGETHFVNEREEEHTVYFRARRGTIDFDEAGEVRRIEAEDGALTTCDCCDVGFDRQPYVVEAGRMIFYPDRLIVAFDLIAKTGGLRVFWLPVYVWPLDETMDSPLFPSVGRSALRGWFLKWNVPFFLSETLYGAITFDYYSRYAEVGLGGSLHYELSGHRGSVSVYNFPAVVGDSVFEFSLDHEVPIDDVWSGKVSVDYAVVGETTETDLATKLSGTKDGWTVELAASEETETADEDEEDDVTWVIQRVPEMSVSHVGFRAGPVTFAPDLDLGRYREFEGDASEPTVDALRASGALAARVRPFEVLGAEVTPRLSVEGSRYQGEGIDQSRGTFRTSVAARRGDVSVSYDLVLVNGDSPFEFDDEVAEHGIAWEVVKIGEVSLSLSGGIALDSGSLDPFTAQLAWTDWARWNLSAEYDPVAASCDSIELAGTWDANRIRATWRVPYLPAEGRFDDVSVTLAISEDRFAFGVDAEISGGRISATTNLEASVSGEGYAARAEIQLEDLTLSEATLSSELTIGAGWGAKVDWAYSGGGLSFDDVRYGVFWDVGGCLRVGIDREAWDTWFYLSVLAFPEAIIRYAPVTSRIELGD